MQTAIETVDKALEKAYREEKAVWIEAHGSNYLRRATALGYECRHWYIDERVAFELPGFQADFDNRARWEIRICPSTEAAAEVKALQGNEHDAVVAWLRRPPKKDTLVNFKPCEAVVIKGYLGEYTLIKIIQ